MRNVVILGSTGSIGRQTLDVLERLPGRFRVLGIAAHGNATLAAEQAAAWSVAHVCLADEPGVLEAFRAAGVPGNPRLLAGVEGMCELATLPEADLIVVAVAGAVGIRPTHAAIEAGKPIALASKEVLVAAGEHTMRLAKERGAAILPIDSEHSAIFQCLQGAPAASIERLFLTASGGPFRQMSAEAMESVTPEQALRHPSWRMGGLVTINSATLMNKGLEVIEAHWLFNVALDDVEVVIHPQSIVHSAVRFRDGSTIAQMGPPDMRLPIQYALLYPERPPTGLPRLDLAACCDLTFSAPDEARFPALGLAREAARRGGTLPAAMNAANEAAVERFVRGEIGFMDIPRTVEAVMLQHTAVEPTYENVLAVDAWARQTAATTRGVGVHAR
ncbi:MAG TPA: 1-deoxy-D-xylulose-5-phosphate reductoisomerase [Chthonomonadales bacterium]|nr:1-deoxy-D-xylulose-5-phosphate reductoisomerase [Chthonomonadales bacterium]